MTDQIIVHTSTECCTVYGVVASRLFLSRDWVTGDRMSDLIRRLATNPNYGPGDHPMWIEERDGGLVLLPALVEEGQAPDVVITIDEDDDPPGWNIREKPLVHFVRRS